MKRFRQKNIGVLFLAVILLLTLFAVPVAAEEEDTQLITVPHLSACTKDVLYWDFPYSDDYFLQPSDEFSRDLAKASFGLEVSSFRQEPEELENQYETYLEAAGFTNITPFGYDEPTSKDTLSGVIASKQIGDFTLIAAAPCGQGYKKEWGGNMEVGNEERHVGFNNAAQILEEKIRDFIEENNISGDKKLWVTGFSRAAAVGNLTAADMIESGLFEDVYAYLFATPRTTKNPVPYLNIYNICGENDPVPQIPFQSWGYERYGLDYYTPAEETNPNYLLLKNEASEVSFDLKDDFLWNNPQVNYELHMIMEFLAELFPTSEEYEEKLQNTLVGMFQNISADHLLESLSIAIAQVEDLDSRQEYSSEIFLDYLSYVISEHSAEERGELNNVRWNSKQGVAENLMREHIPYTYLCWLFSDNTDDELFAHSKYTRRVVINADADVEVWYKGTLVAGAKRDGTIIDPVDFFDITGYDSLGDVAKDVKSILAIRNGTKTVINLPVNDLYSIHIVTYDSTYVEYYDVFCSPLETFGTMGDVNFFAADADTYIIDADIAKNLSDPRAVKGEDPEVHSIELAYSTSVLMADEASTSSHFSLKSMLLMMICIAVFIIALLIACLVIALIHRRGKKKGKTYSPFYVIVPHWILIAVFTLLTQFFTMNLFKVSIARQTCAGITMLLIFLLALRGLLRYRNKRNIIITAVMLVLTVVNFFLYQNSTLVSSSLLHLILYVFFMIVLSLIAAGTFYTGKKSAGDSDPAKEENAEKTEQQEM